MATCSVCGQNVGVPWTRTLLAVLPFILAIAVSPLVESPVLRVVLWLLGAVATWFLFFTFVPLIKR